MAPGGRDQGDFRVSVWAGDNKFLPGKGIYLQKNYIFTFVYIWRKDLALGPRFGPVLGPQRRLLRLSWVVLDENLRSREGCDVYFLPS